MDFGVVTFGATSGAEWRAKVLRYEVAGFDFFFLPDHVGVFDRFPAAAAAAATTAHLRVGTLVLNVEFWNPLLPRASRGHDAAGGRRTVRARLGRWARSNRVRTSRS